MVPKKKSSPRKKTNNRLTENPTQNPSETGSAPSPKKKSSAKKTVRSKKPIQTPESSVSSQSESEVGLKERNRGLGIYADKEFQKPLTTPSKDLIKILTRNPYEAFVFWNILPSTFQKSIDFFKVDKEKIGLELVLEYNTEAGDSMVQKIAIHPLSQNYFCRFLSPVLNLRVTLYAVSGGRYFLLFNSSSIDLPSDKPSFIWDEEWIHPEWIEKGYLVRNLEGKYVLAEGVALPESLPMGSSGFLGSSQGSSSVFSEFSRHRNSGEKSS